MTFRPDLIKSKEPLIPEDVSQTNPDIIQLPFRGFTKQAHPEVNNNLMSNCFLFKSNSLLMLLAGL